MSAEELVEQSRALLAKMPDAARIGIDSEVLAGLCDALAAAEKRADEAEAGLCRELIAERDALRAEVERLRPFEAKEMQRREIFDALNRIGNAPSDD